jgi:CheY-like chemotaxis protein
VWDPTYAAGGRPAILIVMEDPLIRNVLGAALLGHGYFVLTAADRAEVLQLARIFGEQVQILIAALASAGAQGLGEGLKDVLAGVRPELRTILISPATCRQLAASARQIDGDQPALRHLTDVVQDAVAALDGSGAPCII